MSALPFVIESLDHVALNVSDLARSVKWYQQTLGLERRYEESWGDYPVVLCAGAACVALFPAQADAGDPQAQKGVGALRHIAFRLNRANFERARVTLRERGVAFQDEDHRISHSVYLRDPDGHEIELTTYDVRS